MKKKLILLLLTIALGLNQINFTFAQQTKEKTIININEIDANAYIVMDAKTGIILEQKNATIQFHPASTAKIMTAIIALENTQLDDIFVTDNDSIRNIGNNGMNIGLLNREELSLEHHLNALLTHSANDSANIIASNVAITRDDFIRQMNVRASQLGAKKTNFTNPIGLDMSTTDRENLTTAKDLAIMARHALTFPEIREIVTKTRIVIPPTNLNSEEKILGNTNKLLQPYYASEHYKKITGLKTGFTNRAGNCLVASAVDEAGNEIIAVVLGAPSGSIFDFTKNLLEFGFTNFTWETLNVENETYTTLDLPQAQNIDTPNINLATDETIIVPTPKLDNTAGFEIEREKNLNDNITLPIEKGDVLGHISYKINGEHFANTNLISQFSIDEPIPPSLTERTQATYKSTINFFSSNKNYFLTPIIIIVFLILLNQILKFLRRKRKKRKIRRKLKLKKLQKNNKYCKTDFKYFTHYNN